MRRFILLALIATSAHAVDFEAMSKASDFAALESAAKSLLQTNPADQDAAWYLAVSALSGDFDAKADAAIKAMESCIKADPKASKCYQSLGRLYGVRAQRGSLFTGMRLASKIKENFAKAVELAPDRLSARRELNSFYIAAPAIGGGGLDKAEKNVADFSKVDPIAAELLRADVLNAQKKPAEAEAILLKVTIYDKKELIEAHSNSLIGLIARHLNEKRLADAKRVAEFSIARYPENASVQLMLGRTLLESEDIDGAIAALEKSLVLNPRGGAQYRLAMAFEKKGRTDDAVNNYKAFLGLPGRSETPQGKDAQARMKALAPQ